MKNVMVALVCTLGAVACGENRPAENPAPPVATTTETTTTSAPREEKSPVTTTTETPSIGETGRTGATMPQSAPPAATDSMRSSNPDMRTTAPATTAPATTGTSSPGSAPAASNPGSADKTKDATNPKTNDRDRHGTATPGDQGTGKDREITAAVRRAVVSDGSLSFNAKNIKIITTGGKVTLRGPVKSDAEKTTIESKAKATPGVTYVDNQIEVKK